MLAGGALAALALAAGGFLLGRATLGDPPPAPAPSGPPLAKVEAPPPPVVEPVLGRADLIRAAAAAADSFTAGRPAGAGNLVGRRFELRLPFGCAGPQPDDAPLRWRYDDDAEVLRLHAEPAQFSVEEWLGPEAREGIEAVEGFWIERPWTSSEDCPAPVAAASPETESEATEAAPAPTLGIAQIFTAQGSRQGRRNGQAYEAVVRKSADAIDVTRGLRLRLSGRIAAAAAPRPILCRAADPAHAPRCLILAELSEVAIENPANGETLAQWDVSTHTSASD